MTRNEIRPLVRASRRYGRNEHGAAAVEFALIAPIFVLILAATVEIGLVIQQRFQLVSVLTAAANHALSIDASDDDSVNTAAATIAALMAGGARTARVDVNNTVTATMAADEITLAQTGAQSTDCYCPTGAGTGLSWGNSIECETPCDDGSTAGRFVTIAVEAPFIPILGAYGVFDDDMLRSATVVRLP